DSLNLLGQFSSLIGIAYQLKDDLEDIDDDAGISRLRNPSVIISLLAERSGDEAGKSVFEAISKNDRGLLHELIKSHRVTEQIDEMIEEYLGLIDKCLSGLRNIPLKLALYE